jgi:hypothetical protein
MKTFKQLFEAPGAPAQDNKPDQDTDDEVKGYKPRSKGEEEFANIANMHMVSKVNHPVATDAQFTGNIKAGNPDHHQGGKKQAPGETDPVQQGSSKIKESFSSFIEEETDGDD